jgi:lipid-binding SYLF domain-containing protein
MNYRQLVKKIFIPFLVFGLMLGSHLVRADDQSVLDQDIDAALHQLRNSSTTAKEIMKKAKAALVFPNIVKAGFIVGVQHGEGGLAKRKQSGGYYISDYYSVTAASYGLQAGIQSFGYVMLLMTDAAVEHAETNYKWELGSGPSIVIMDKGKAKTTSTETLKDDVYAFTFGQEGLMAGMGLQGSKISKLD